MTPAPEPVSHDAETLVPELDRLLHLAWTPGWAPLATRQLIELCTALRAQSEQWPALRAVMRGHDIHRLMHEDPLVSQAIRPEISRAEYLDLVLGHPDAAPLCQDISRAGRDLNAVTRALPWFGALRGRTAYLAAMVEAVAALRPGADILTLRAGHLREAEAVANLAQLRRWMVLEPDNPTRAVLNRGAPLGLPVQSMRGSLGYFSRRPFRHGCFDLVCLPRLPDCPPAEQQELLEAAFAVLKPGGRLLVCAMGQPVPENAWIETFLQARVRWSSRRELEALLAVIPPAECADRQVFPSLDGHLLHAILQRRG